MMTVTLRALRKFAILGALLVSAGTVFAQNASPVGLWQTVDDKTGHPLALVKISENADGTLSGVVVQGLTPGANLKVRCTKCTDERKDQPILGMTIIRAMKHDGAVWDGGDVLDPKSGQVYRCKLSLTDGGQQLVVRGYIGVSLFGRSQTWIRQQ
ncbi:MAG: DUF2147 domain-containing protein [Burkholderiaceae bacterium]|jgi:uncharacterized protein (DUF2147 family)|nr:DUF2147 domain-containing protein [Burkholderiaceae bacterium]